ncbi:MAG: hypothetical protein MUC60_15675 [Oscillatoria sp. Prado101]|nr:hypothetical protein [Oscillatoria sp. Prado101]
MTRASGENFVMAIAVLPHRPLNRGHQLLMAQPIVGFCFSPPPPWWGMGLGG